MNTSGKAYYIFVRDFDLVSLTVQSLDISLIPLQDYPLITQDWVIARVVQLLGKVTRDIACLCL